MSASPRPEAEALRELRERLERTQSAAQELAEEAARSLRERAGQVPPAGWDVPRRAGEVQEELDALVALLRTARDLVPPELRAQLAELVRALLLFARAVVDWWIVRLEASARGEQARAAPRAPEVEDIPVS